MNILPLILALVLMLSVLTIERMEKFKNQSIIQRQYQVFLKDNERQVFNQRERRLYGENQISLRQLTFRYVYDKKVREKHPNEAKQYRTLIIELMRNVYGEAAFFKELEKKRSNFLEEMLTAIEEASEEASVPFIKRIQELSRLNLEDSELQEAFYHMLKGTILRDQLKEMKEPTPHMKEKAYLSLFTFINNHGAESPPLIRVALCPRETLKALFVDDNIVEEVVKRRKELGGKDRDSGADETFKNEFIGKRRPGIDEKLLDFKLSPNSSAYD